MHSARKPWWQQAAALVNISAGGVVTGISFVPGAASAAHTPAGTQIQLMALAQSGRQAARSGDAALRSAIVNVAHYYLRMAAHKTPAEMDAIIWRRDSLDGAGHGASCAAFASLTLELAAQVVGQQSWVSGGGTYPWPLHDWADVRVNPNPDSPDITSMVQDARAHHRWHPVASGYQPLPGDWVVFDGHVEVVTRYAGGVLHSVGADSLPDYSVNAHEFADPFADRGVLGFVNNGAQPEPASAPQPGSRQPEAGSGQVPGSTQQGTHRGTGGAPRHPHAPGSRPDAAPAAAGHAAIPGAPGPAAPRHHRGSGWHHVRPARDNRPTGPAKIPGLATGDQAGPGWRPDRAWSAASIPGLQAVSNGAGPAASPGRAGSGRGSDAGGYGRHHPSPAPAPPLSEAAQQAFIRDVAPGALDSQRRYGVPAAVTIAQAIDESGWGRSDLAAHAHNLFGIKGTGPAGHQILATLEYEHGQRVRRQASFRAYHTVAESIADHGRLLATSHYYRQAMADRHDPNAFAAALTGVYATDPGYGANLIRLMRHYDLYRYDAARNAGPAGPHGPAGAGSAAPAGTTPARNPPTGNAATRNPPTRNPPTRNPATRNPATANSAAPNAPTGNPAARGAAAGNAPAGSTAQRSPAGNAPAGNAPAGSADQAGRNGGAAAPHHGTAAPHRGAAAVSSGRGRNRAGAGGRAPGGGVAPGRHPHGQPRPGQGGAAIPGLMHVAAGATTTACTGSPAPYQPRIPLPVRNAFTTLARERLLGAESLYRDVASSAGIHWALLAACDWMQCEARPRYSPVRGEKLGTPNPDGTAYRTKSEALEQCADDLVQLAWAVYQVDLTWPGGRSICELAKAFAAFRWGGLLHQHHTSAMEFPYSVAGLTGRHMNMRWPSIGEPNSPDKPGGRFRRPFGAVPVVVSLRYPATV